MTLRTKTTLTNLTPEEIVDYRSNWWIRSNKIGSDTMPIWHRSDFKQALSTFRQLKDKDEAQRNQRWTQSSSSCGTGKDHGRILLTRITTKTYPAPIDQGKLDKRSDWDTYSRHDFQNSIALLQLDRLQLTALYCNRRGV